MVVHLSSEIQSGVTELLTLQRDIGIWQSQTRFDKSASEQNYFCAQLTSDYNRVTFKSIPMKSAIEITQDRRVYFSD